MGGNMGNEILSELIVRWLLDLEALSTRRLVGHDLINFMTPLSMQISMLERNLIRGEQEAALERISKVQRSLAKIEDFSKEQFLNYEEIEAIPIALDKAVVEELLYSVVDLLSLSRDQLTLAFREVAEHSTIDMRLLALYFYYVLDLLRDHHAIRIRFDDKPGEELKISISGEERPEKISDPVLSRLNRFKKIVNSTTMLYEMSNGEDANTTWALTLHTK